MKTLTKVLLALLFAGNAFAGSLEVTDEDGLIGSRPAIEAAASAATFDVRVLVSSNRGHGTTFDQSVDRALPGPNAVVIGVDPAGHHTHIKVGAALGIPGSLVGSIAITANGNFKAKEWDTGIARMIEGLQAERKVPQAAAPVTIPVAPLVLAPVAVTPSEPVSGWVWLFGILIVVLALWGIYRLIRKEKQRRLEEEERQLAADLVRKTDYWRTEGKTAYEERRKLENANLRESVNIIAPQSTFTRQVPVASPTTIIHEHDNRNDALINYMMMDNLLNHHNPPPAKEVVHHYEPAPEPIPSYSYGGSSGSSDWGSSSSFDSGSSSFDSGSSGGGSDW